MTQPAAKRKRRGLFFAWLGGSPSPRGLLHENQLFFCPVLCKKQLMKRQSPVFAKIMDTVCVILTLYLREGRFLRAKEGQTASFTRKQLKKMGYFV